MPVEGWHPVTVAWYWWQATWRTAWRPALVVVLLTGLLGAVSLAALAGARRTESAYGRYLQSIRASDVMVNIPSTDTTLITRVEHLPGVRSSASAMATMSDAGRTQLRKTSVAFVFQKYNLLPTLTARDNIAVAKDIAAATRSPIPTLKKCWSSWELRAA